MSLTILIGDYGTGKTATAKYLAKQAGGVYFDVDTLSQGNGNYDSCSLVDKLKAIIKPGRDYFMDGFPAGYYYGTITSELLGVEVKYIVCMADPKNVIQRQIKKAHGVSTPLPRSSDEIKSITHLAASIALTYDNDPLFADTTTKPPTFWKKHDWFLRWMEINIYASLKDAGEYQDVELSDRAIVGLSESYKTWDRLSVLVDFKGKSVIDYGCNYGYFCFRAEQAGAGSVLGVDESQSVLNMAISIAMTKGSKAKFITSELKAFDPPDTDIIMALNVLHHLDNDSGVLNKMFQCAGTVVLEIPVKDLAVIDAEANYHQFGEPVIASSHREDRVIVIYSKAKLAVLPRKFVYRPKRAAFTKWVLHALRRLLPLMPIRHTGIVVKIKRILRLR